MTNFFDWIALKIHSRAHFFQRLVEISRIEGSFFAQNVICCLDLCLPFEFLCLLQIELALLSFDLVACLLDEQVLASNHVKVLIDLLLLFYLPLLCSNLFVVLIRHAFQIFKLDLSLTELHTDSPSILLLE